MISAGALVLKGNQLPTQMQRRKAKISQLINEARAPANTPYGDIAPSLQLPLTGGSSGC